MLKKNETPVFAPDAFELTEYFAGNTIASGVFEDRFGRVRKTFVVEIEGFWRDGTFLMDEFFTYGDGSTDARVWQITPRDDGRFTGVCKDIIRPAVGRQTGRRLTMNYKIGLQIGARKVVVRFDDSMYLLDDGSILNRARVSKWGITLGTATIVFRQVADQSALED